MPGVAQVACGWNLTVAVTRDGKAFQMGSTEGFNSDEKGVTWEGCSKPTQVDGNLLGHFVEEVRWECWTESTRVCRRWRFESDTVESQPNNEGGSRVYITERTCMLSASESNTHPAQLGCLLLTVMLASLRQAKLLHCGIKVQLACRPRLVCYKQRRVWIASQHLWQCHFFRHQLAKPRVSPFQSPAPACRFSEFLDAPYFFCLLVSGQHVVAML